MRKTVLILLILITSASSVFCQDFPDYIDGENSIPALNQEEITQEAPTEELSSDTTPEQLPPEASSDEPPKEDSLLEKVAEINSIQDDEEKVKAWAKFNSEKNYVIINKKNCSATVYDTDGNEIKTFEVGIGMEKGDDFNDTKGLSGKPKNTTPAGEYTLTPNVYNKSAYGDITLSLGDKANKTQNSKKVVALHKVPKFRQEARLKKFYDGNLANNRMSHGCINFIEDDFKELTKYIHGGLKTYVLPEESDNKLALTKNDEDKFELTQTKY